MSLWLLWMMITSFYNDSYKFSTWIGVIVRTQVGRYIRKKRDNIISFEELSGRGGGEDRSVEFSSKEERPEDFLASQEEIEILKKALEELGFKDRLILTLAYFDEKDYKEIAEIMEISINSVGAYLFRAKNKLTKLLKKLRPED